MFGFISERLPIKDIHLIDELIERFLERSIDLHMAFTDLEKTFNNVPREILIMMDIDEDKSLH